MNYCKCKQVNRIYEAYSGNKCCSECFMPVKNLSVKLFKASLRIDEDDHNYLVKNHGHIVKSFNKYTDDFAITKAKSFYHSLIN